MWQLGQGVGKEIKRTDQEHLTFPPFSLLVLQTFSLTDLLYAPSPELEGPWALGHLWPFYPHLLWGVSTGRE